MTSFLFPVVDLVGGARSKNDVAPFLSDVARATIDSADALVLFKNLIEGHGNEPESPGFMAFDAHGGDAGCQLRAGMMQETFLVYRYIYNDFPDIWVRIRGSIDESATKLREVHERAKKACKDVMTHKVHPKVFGGPTADTLKLLGWDITNTAKEADLLSSLVYQSLSPKRDQFPSSISFLDHFLPLSDTSTATSDSSTPSSPASFSTRTSNTPTEYDSDSSSSELCSRSAEDVDLSQLHPLTTHPNAANSRVAKSIARVKCFFGNTLPMTCTWDPLSFDTLTRFVVYCYVLSKYKAFSIANNTVSARTAPEVAANVSNSFLGPSNRKKKGPEKPQRILRELRDLQSWLSELSCAWQKSLAQRSNHSVDMERLLLDTIQTSDKGLKSMACYPGYLLLRESWASMNTTMLLVDRHFCPSGGFHYNVFLASMNAPVFNAPLCQKHPLGVRVSWSLKRIELKDLIQDSDSVTPHLTIMGNSIDGGHTEYMRRFETKSRPHTTDICGENEDHIQKFLSADHDRLALAFFASHDSYAFPVSEVDRTVVETSGVGHGTDAETEFVKHRIDLWAHNIACEGDLAAVERAGTLKESWINSRREADEMGTGHGGMHTFTWQHALLETKARVAKRIERWMDIGDLMPLHAPIGTARGNDD